MYIQKVEFPGCCALDVISGFPYLNQLSNELARQQSIYAARYVVSEAEGKQVLIVFSEADQKDWIDLFDTCPYAKRVISVESRHGDYQNVMFLVMKGEFQKDEEEDEFYEDDDF